MMELCKTNIGKYIHVLVDIGSNGSDEQISKNLNMKDEPDYAYIIRTLNLNNNDFENNIKYIDEKSYNFFAKSKMYGGEVIINKIGCPGTIGLMPFLDKPISLGLNQYAIRFNNEVDQLYMYYNLKNIEPYLQSLAHGTTTKTLTKDDIKGATIYIHNLPTQKIISKYLSNIDKVINNYKKIIKNLNNIINLYYVQYMENFSFKTTKKYDSVLNREIPENWTNCKISNLVKILSGYPFKTTDYVDNGNYKLYTIKNVQDGKIITKVDNYVNKIKNVPDYCFLKKGDLLLSLTGNVGRCAIVFEQNAILNQRVGLIKPINNNNRGFIYALFNSNRIKTTLLNIATGTSQKNLSPVNTENVDICIPDGITLIKIGTFLNVLYDQITQLNLEIDKLENYKNYIFPKLMRGQIKIGD